MSVKTVELDFILIFIKKEKRPATLAMETLRKHKKQKTNKTVVDRWHTSRPINEEFSQVH